MFTITIITQLERHGYKVRTKRTGNTGEISAINPATNERHAVQIDDFGSVDEVSQAASELANKLGIEIKDG